MNIVWLTLNNGMNIVINPDHIIFMEHHGDNREGTLIRMHDGTEILIGDTLVNTCKIIHSNKE